MTEKLVYWVCVLGSRGKEGKVMYHIHTSLPKLLYKVEHFYNFSFLEWCIFLHELQSKKNKADDKRCF